MVQLWKKVRKIMRKINGGADKRTTYEESCHNRVNRVNGIDMIDSI